MDKMEMIFATHNRHKLQEVREILGDRIILLGLDDVGIQEEIPETGKTLKENALLKAKYVWDKTNKPVFADDTGLEVEALGGEPGVYSARYAGEGKSSMDNISLLIKNLEDKKNRRARFKTVIAFIKDGKESFLEGIVRGEILSEWRGTEGFGYDPVFLPEGYNKTFAELSMEEKNKISHRGIAIRSFIDFLKNEKLFTP